MKPAPFQYHRPSSLAEVLECLATLDDAKPLAGGQSLMPMMNFRYLTPAHLVDLNDVVELEGIDADGATLTIGAMTRQRALERSPLVRAHCPLLAEALGWVGHVQTRNRGTIGGSLCHLDPAAELPGVLLAHDAVLEVAGPAGERQVPMGEWALAYMSPDLEPDELLVRIRLPLWPRGHRHGFAELARRRGDFAIAGAAVLAVLGDGIVRRIAVTLVGVDDSPLRLAAAQAVLTGHRPTPERIEAAARAALEVPGLDDVLASADYRREVAAVTARRALHQALAPAPEAQP